MSKRQIFPKVDVKRTVAFSLAIEPQDATGAAVDPGPGPVRSEVRRLSDGQLIATLTGYTDGGKVIVEASRSQMAAWPVTTDAVRLVCDVRVGGPGEEFVCETFELVVEAEVTAP